MPLKDAVLPLRAPVLIEVDDIRGRFLRKGTFHHSCYVKHSHGQHTSLLNLPDNLIDISPSFIHLSRVLVGHYVVEDGADGEHCWVHINSKLLKNAIHFVL